MKREGDKFSPDFNKKRESIEQALDDFRYEKSEMIYSPMDIIKRENRNRSDKDLQNEKNSFEFIQNYCKMEKNEGEILDEVEKQILNSQLNIQSNNIQEIEDNKDKMEIDL